MTSIPIDRLNDALSDRYRIERKIGEGGMATVYLADDLKHERKVALKVLQPELAAVVGAERFLTAPGPAGQTRSAAWRSLARRECPTGRALSLRAWIRS